MRVPVFGNTTKMESTQIWLNVIKISGSVQNKAEFSSLQIASHLDTLPADKIRFFYSRQSIVFTLSECIIKPLSWKFQGLSMQEQLKRVTEIV